MPVAAAMRTISMITVIRMIAVVGMAGIMAIPVISLFKSDDGHADLRAVLNNAHRTVMIKAAQIRAVHPSALAVPGNVAPRPAIQTADDIDGRMMANNCDR